MYLSKFWFAFNVAVATSLGPKVPPKCSLDRSPVSRSVSRRTSPRPNCVNVKVCFQTGLMSRGTWGVDCKVPAMNDDAHTRRPHLPNKYHNIQQSLTRINTITIDRGRGQVTHRRGEVVTHAKVGGDHYKSAPSSSPTTHASTANVCDTAAVRSWMQAQNQTMQTKQAPVKLPNLPSCLTHAAQCNCKSGSAHP